MEDDWDKAMADEWDESPAKHSYSHYDRDGREEEEEEEDGHHHHHRGHDGREVEVEEEVEEEEEGERRVYDRREEEGEEEEGRREDRTEREASRHKRRRGSDSELLPPPPPLPFGLGSETEYRILCPVAKIGAIIGKGGSIIKTLREETRAKIKVEDAIHGADERVIYISSSSLRDGDGREGERERDVEEREEMLCPAQEALFRIHGRITERDDIGKSSFERKEEEEEGEDDNDNDDNSDKKGLRSTQISARLLVSDGQVGCLIGKGGRIIEQMRKDIAAQIRVLPKSSLPPCAFPNDELVQLSGTPAVVRKALYVVSRKLHENPVRERAHRPQGFSQGGSFPGGGMYSSVHAPSNMMTVGHYNRSGSANSFPMRSGRSDGSSEEELMVCILCPNEKIGSMIGKGGSIIRKLREESAAKIRVCDQVGNADERVIQISSIEHIEGFASPVLEAAMQVFRRLADISADKDGRNAILSIRLLVRSSQIGCLLGKGGQIITEMRKMSRANIRIPPKEELPVCADDGSELVQLSGEAPMVEAALIQVLTRLRSNLFKGRDVSHGNPGMMPIASYQGSSVLPSYGGGRDEQGSPRGYSYDYGSNTSPGANRSSKDSRRRRR